MLSLEIPYQGQHAEIYDLIYAEKPYGLEAACISEKISRLATTQTRKVLDMACGTGSHAIELARQGHQVCGLDISPDMISVAQGKSPKNLDLRFFVGSMQRLPFEAETFEVVTCLFDSIGYLVANDAILDCIKEVRRVLKSGGVFVWEFWHAPAMLSSFEPSRTKTFLGKGHSFVRRSQTQLNIPEQTAQVAYEIEGFLSDASVLIKETQKNRFFQCQEMAFFATQAGLTMIEMGPAYSSGSIDSSVWHILAVAQKQDAV